MQVPRALTQGGGQARWRPSSAEQGWGRPNQRAQRPRRDQNSHTTGTTAAPQSRATGAEGPDMAGTERFPAGAEGPDTGGRTRKARVPDDWQAAHRNAKRHSQEAADPTSGAQHHQAGPGGFPQELGGAE